MLAGKFKCDGRVLRRDTERMRRLRRCRRQPSARMIRQFEDAFFPAVDRKAGLFECPACGGALRGPVTLGCGHTFCGACLDPAANKCRACGAEGDGDGGARRVNVLVQDLVDKRSARDRTDDFAAGVPDTVDILGVEPRYHLRSGYAGLQINGQIESKMTNLLHPSNAATRQTKEARLLSKSGGNVFDCSLRNLWFGDNLDDCDSFQETIESVFRKVDDIKEEALKSSWDCITPTDLECILCSQCLLDPVTTECGHTFCRGCLVRVLDHGLACPLCMAALSAHDYSRGTTEVLQRAARFLVPDDSNERLSNSLRESQIPEKGSDIPVFVCTNAFPGVACPLYVYEPRYRLLARRCLNSPSKKFAMAGKGSRNGERFVKYGTVLEVKDAVHLEDGRFILTTVGVRRYKVVSSSEQDGYDTAKVQYMKDAAVSAEKLPELIALHEKVHNKAIRWIRSLKAKVLAEVERLIGLMPPVEQGWSDLPDGPSWAWWLMPILPLSSQLQVGFLNTTSLEKRLRAIDKLLDHMKVRMKALERNTVACSRNEDPLDSCGETERSYDLPFNDN